MAGGAGCANYRADKFLLKKIATAFTFLEEARADDNHPLRQECRSVRSIIHRENR
jgi:hypothetical protein